MVGLFLPVSILFPTGNSFSTTSYDGRRPTAYIEYDCGQSDYRLSSCESSPDSSAEYCYQAVHVTCASMWRNAAKNKSFLFL